MGAAPRAGNLALWGSYVMPAQPLRNITKIAAGWNYNLALDQNGKVYFWQFNDGANGNLPAALDSGVAEIACMAGYPYAVKSDHTIVSWGASPGGWNHPPAGLNNISHLPSGSFNYLALTTEGKAVMWGNPPWRPGPPANLEGVKALASGGTFDIALKTDGTLVIWGWMNGITPVAPPGLKDVAAIAATGWNEVAYALRQDGTVLAWKPVNGKTSSEPDGPVLPAGLSDVVAIAAGMGHGMALKADGTVVSWGGYASDLPGNSGQYVPMVDPPAGLKDVTAIAAGWYHCLALKRDGTVVQWGSIGAGGDFAPGDKALKVVAGSRAVTVLKADGTVTTWGDRASPAPAGLKDIVDVAMGDNAVLAVKSDSTVVSWSSGNDQVPAGLSGVKTVATGPDNGFGRFNNLALKNDGSVVAWGWWSDPSPNGFQGAQAIAADGIGNQHANGLILDTNGFVHAWGVSWVTPPKDLSNVVAVAVGAYHGLALKTDGTVASWGTPDVRHAPPAGLTDVIKVYASGNDSMAIRADGSVVTWGGIAWGAPPPSPPAGLAGAFDGAVGSGLYGVIYNEPEPAQLTRHCPMIGEVGTEITLEGSALTWVTNVLFNGLPAEGFKRTSDFVIRVKVPPGATTGPITVHSAYGNATDAQEFVVPNGLTPIESWRRLYFQAPEPTGIAADNADSDGDHMVNLLEYYAATHPRQADVRPSLIGRGLVTDGGEPWFEFLERHYVRATDVTVHYEWTTTEWAPFQPYTGEVKQVGVQAGENCETEYLIKRVRAPVGGSSLLIRYHLTRP